MARTNTKAGRKDYKGRSDATVNKEGGLAFKVSPERELFLRSVTCLFGEPKFYSSEKTDTDEIFTLVDKVAETNPEFILQLADYCRNEMYLRTLPVALLAKASMNPKTKQYVREYTPNIVKRADELSEAIAMFRHINGIADGQRRDIPIPASLKRGLADTFHNFDEYQYAKYDQDRSVKLSDVIRIVRPKPLSPEESALFKNIRTRMLKTPDTWEVKISGEGASKKTWEEVLPSMGFMARLRNLRNFIDHGVDISPVVKMFNDETAVAKSKQFPYRFLSAYKEIDGYSPAGAKLCGALEEALELSVKNVPRLDGTTFVTTDNSGSMQATLSQKSKVSRQEVGNLMGAMAFHFSDHGIASVFGEDHEVVKLMKRDSILTNMQKLCNTHVGHSTNAWKAIDYLLKTNTKVDRILLFSDMQCYNSTGWGYGTTYYSVSEKMHEYRKRVNPNVKLYSFDLAGYGTSQVPENDTNTYLLGGFSDRVFRFIKLVEDGTDPLEVVKNFRKNSAETNEEE